MKSDNVFLRRIAGKHFAAFPVRCMKVTVGVSSILLLMAGWDPSLHAQETRRELPNIVLLVADDLGYGELGCQGNPQIPTPHIDSIATNGIRFTQGYVTAPFCSASRAGLMTGRYQTRFGYEFNPVGAQNEDPNAGLPVSERTLADVLTDAGYITALIGKWHLGGTAKYHPQRRGFDAFFGFLHEGHYFVPPPFENTTTWLRRKTLPGGGSGTWNSADGNTFYSTEMGHNEPDYDADNPIYRAGQPVVENEYLTDAWTREAVKFIRQNRDRPFFLYLAYNAVHSPMQSPADLTASLSDIEDPHRRIFAGMLTRLDQSVGSVLDALRSENLDQDTLVFFISDNGGPTKELTSSNLPLRGGKGTVYEGGIRVPFLAQWPGRLPANQTYDQPVVSLDIFATAVALSNGLIDPQKTYDGVNLLPFLLGENSERPHKSLFWRIGDRQAFRVNDWKIVRQQRHGRDGPQRWELYDLADDLAEEDDLAASQREKLIELQKAWDRLDAEMIEPVWSPRSER
jgi:arylsulfatase A-like enzyme